MASTRRLPLLALLLLGTACPAEDEPVAEDSSGGGETGTGSTAVETSSGETSSESSSGSSGDPLDPACACVEEDDFVENVCDVDEICEPLQVACEREPIAGCEIDELTVVNPDLLECHHAALVAGGAGALRWELPYIQDPGVEGQRFWLFLDGSQALTWHEAWGPPTYAISDVAVVELRPAEHFDGCMELPAADEVFRCLFDAAQTIVDVCVPAHEFEIG
jgi:hypothetical protein